LNTMSVQSGNSCIGTEPDSCSPMFWGYMVK
jgi:hypothetical protein